MVPPEALVGLRVQRRGRRSRPQGLGHLLGGHEQRSRSPGLEVQAETAHRVPVVLQVVGVEEHRAARVREAEHEARVVGEQHVGDQQELGGVRVRGHVTQRGVGRDAARHPRMPADQHGGAPVQRACQREQVERGVPAVQRRLAEGDVGRGVREMVAVRRRVQHHPVVVGDAQLPAYPFGRLVPAGGEQQVVGR